MRNWFLTLAAVVLMTAGTAALAIEDVKIGSVTVKGEDIGKFYNAVGDYFGLKEDQIGVFAQRGLSQEELPVALMIAEKAGVSPTQVINMRLSGKSWDQIRRQFGLSPEIFYAPVTKEVSGPPYGNAYGYYKNKDKKDWDKEVTLTDEEVVNLTNLKFVSEYYGCQPEEVIQMRQGGQNFVVIKKEVETKAVDKGWKRETAGKVGGKADSNKDGKGAADKGQGQNQKVNKDKGQGAGKTQEAGKGGGQGKGKGKGKGGKAGDKTGKQGGGSKAGSSGGQEGAGKDSGPTDQKDKGNKNKPK